MAYSKGSVESLVKFVKINFLAGRSFIDDADLQAQCVDWQERSNTTRPSQATDVTPLVRLVEEVAKGYPLPKTATDYGFAQPGQVTAGARVGPGRHRLRGRRTGEGSATRALEPRVRLEFDDNAMVVAYDLRLSTQVGLKL